MKQRPALSFTHHCLGCNRRWFTSHHEARCPNCGSNRRQTFKLVPYMPEYKSHREILIYLKLMLLAAVIFGLVQL